MDAAAEPKAGGRVDSPVSPYEEDTSVHSWGTGVEEAVGTRPSATRIQHRVGRLVFEVALTLAAIVGVLVSVTTVAAATNGVKPLVVRSGSMEPTIPTGAMVLTRRVEAPTVQVGDIVTVERPDRTRVTHRVIGLKRQRDAVEFTLKGDANKDPDPYPVTVGHVLRVVGQVPVVGRAMAWFASAQGGFFLGVVVTAVVTNLVRARHGPGGE